MKLSMGLLGTNGRVLLFVRVWWSTLRPFLQHRQLMKSLWDSVTLLFISRIEKEGTPHNSHSWTAQPCKEGTVISLAREEKVFKALVIRVVEDQNSMFVRERDRLKMLGSRFVSHLSPHLAHPGFNLPWSSACANCRWVLLEMLCS